MFLYCSQPGYPWHRSLLQSLNIVVTFLASSEPYTFLLPCPQPISVPPPVLLISHLPPLHGCHQFTWLSSSLWSVFLKNTAKKASRVLEVLKRGSHFNSEQTFKASALDRSWARPWGTRWARPFPVWPSEGSHESGKQKIHTTLIRTMLWWERTGAPWGGQTDGGHTEGSSRRAPPGATPWSLPCPQTLGNWPLLVTGWFVWEGTGAKG